MIRGRIAFVAGLLVAACRLASGQCELAPLVGEDVHREDWYGMAIGVSGDVAMVGAPAHYSSPHNGRVFIFQRDTPVSWPLVQILDTGQLGFGKCLVVEGNLALFVAAMGPRLFERRQEGWTQVAHLVPAAGWPGLGGSPVGQVLAIQGNVIVAGAPGGATAFIFQRTMAGDWAEAAQLNPSEGGAGFGNSVAINGDTVVVGAPNDFTQGSWAGAAFVFERQGNGSWLETARLLASDGSSFDSFGEAVVFGGQHLLVGAALAGPQENGQVYVFERDADGRWGQTQILLSDPSPEWTYFGGWMAARDGLLLVGAKWDFGTPGVRTGSVYVFGRDNAQWRRIAKLVPEAGYDLYRFGELVALSGQHAVVTAGLWDTEFGWQSGDVSLHAVGPDTDGDGTMDVCECLAAGDLDLSGSIGLQDLLLLLSSFGVDSGGDGDDDGDTDLQDLLILLAHFGEACP